MAKSTSIMADPPISTTFSRCSNYQTVDIFERMIQMKDGCIRCGLYNCLPDDLKFALACKMDCLFSEAVLSCRNVK